MRARYLPILACFVVAVLLAPTGQAKYVRWNSNSSAPPSSDNKESIWQRIGEIRQDDHEKEQFRREVEASAYEFTKELCYMYEFRVAKEIGLEGTHPFKESFYREPYEYVEAFVGSEQDMRLQRSVGAWFIIVGQSIESAFWNGDVKYLLLRRSKYSQILITTEGFDRATQECAENIHRIGRRTSLDESEYMIDIKKIMQADINFNDTSFSIIADFAFAGVTSQALKWFARTGIGQQVTSTLARIGLRVGTWQFKAASFVGGGLVFASPYVVRELRLREQHQELLASVKQNPSILIIDPNTDDWSVRRSRAMQFVIHWDNWLGLTGSVQDLRPANNKAFAEESENVERELGYFKADLSGFKQKQAELEKELLAIPNVENRVAELLAKQKDGAVLLPAEQILLNKALFYGALDTITKIIAARANQSRR